MMQKTEVECVRCKCKTIIGFYPPLNDLENILSNYNEPMLYEYKQHNLSNLLKYNQELGEQNRKMKARLETINDFMQTVFGEEIDVVTLWQMSEIVSRLERLKQE